MAHIPLRTALIGLSSSAKTSWASAAHLPGLLSPTGRSKFTITALLNSSVAAAQSAIKTYNLPSTTKAYGSPQDLAADADIDLVICNTRVDSHYQTIIDSVKAGKDVYVEWPIAAKAEHIQELVEASKKSGSRVAVGLQGRWGPSALKIRDILNEGSLGSVLSSDVRAYGGSKDREMLPTGLKYFAEKAIGGNVIVIGFGHAFDTVLSVLGEVHDSSVQARTQLQRPSVRIRDVQKNEIVETITSDVPDLLTLHAGLVAHNNATLSFLFRRGQPFPGTPSLTWSINCEFGEIRVVAPSGTTLALQSGAQDSPVTIQLHRFDTDEVHEVEWGWSERQAALPLMARSVSECLYAFAEGREEGDGWVGLESAAKRAQLIRSFLGE